MMDELYHSKVFYKIDLTNDYYHIRIRECQNWKTTLKSKGGLFEWLVLIFRLSKAYMIFRRPYLGRFMVGLPRDNGESITFNLVGLTPYLKRDHLTYLMATRGE